MSKWTDSARRELDDYFNRVRPVLVATGADADEVIEDLRRHLDTEIQSAGLQIVTEGDVRRLLLRIGAPQPGSEAARHQSASGLAIPPQITSAPKAGYFLLLCGTLLPTFTLLFELLTGSCAGAFFDPIPSLWHVLLVAMVPAVNALTWAELRKGKSTRHALLGWLNGAAIGVGIYYSILYAPLMLPGILGVLFLGFGLLPLTPAISLGASLVLRKKLRAMNGDRRLSGFWRGTAVAWLALLVLATPGLITKIAMNKSISDDPEEQLTGIRWLRAVGDKDLLLRACYGFTAGAANADVTNWLTSNGRRVTPDRAREIYFRVTGRPFNSVPAPTVRTGRGVWNDLNEWTWDDDQGGEKVGGRIRGLYLHSSRLDSTINADAAWSYTEWTMEFRNDSIQQREARAEILLPPGGVVSRLTLWVDGEEREAAFAGRAQTRQAYQKVAIQQRRDPVLVATAGPDRVLMQCFPVQPNGGIMKVRLGITAPVALDSAASGVCRLPMMLERNFTVRDDLHHHVWIQGPHGLNSDSEQLVTELSGNGTAVLRGQLTDPGLSSRNALMTVTRDPNLRFAWTKDTRSSDKRFIRQTIVEETAVPPSRIIFVVDGSMGMQPYWQEIVEAFGKMPATTDHTIIVASDRVEILESVDALESFVPVGGQDNLPALVRAWNLAVQHTNSAIVWIHGPQPVQLESEQALLQAIERTAYPPKLYEIQTQPGPNQIIRRLDGVRSLRSVLRSGNLKHDAAELIGQLSGSSRIWGFQREQVDSESDAQADNAVEGTLQIARLWANDAVARMPSSRGHTEAAKLAALYQLVTPVSGAVVLETAQQYAETGLAPVDPETVPSIPEPSAISLMILGAVALWFTRRHRKFRRAENCQGSFK